MKTKLLLLLLLANFSIYAQINLVPNFGFETWAAGIPQNWTVANSVVSSNDFASGQFSARLSFTTVSPKIIAQVPMKAGVTYTVKYKYKYVNTNFGGDHPIALNISKAGSSTTLSSSTFATNNLWTSKETTFTPDADLSYDLSISTFSFDSATFAVLIDDVEVYIQGTEQYTLIPDVNFEKKLIALGIDSGTPDGKVLTNNVNKLTSLDVSYSSITDLTGIQDFVSLTGFYTLQNKVVNLDLSKNINLTNFRCDSNTTLETLNVANCTKLTTLLCGNNKIKSLDLTRLTLLKELYCDRNQLENIDLSQNIKLQKLYIDNNPLAKLDLSKNSELNYLYCRSNRYMSQLNLQNGKNTLLNGNSLIITENYNLTCILVDDVAYSNTNWSASKDSTVDYSLVCSEPEYTLIPDVEFEKKLIANGMDLVIDGKVLTRKIATFKNLNLDDSPITDLTGLEGFTSLEILNCSKIKATKFDFSKNTKLVTLNCTSNNLSTIDVSNLVYLKNLNLYNNNLTSIDVSKNQVLEGIALDKNKFTAIDFSANKTLTSINCSNNPITKIYIAQNPALKFLTCTDVQITSLDLSQNPNLLYLDFERNKMTTIDLSKNLELQTLNCAQNPISSLNLTTNKKLLSLNCSGSYYSDNNGGAGKITTLDLSNNILLQILDCSSNQISRLDLTPHTKLEILRCYGNLLTDLDLSKNIVLKEVNSNSNRLKTLNLKNGNNTKITSLSLASNAVLSCIQVDDVTYANANWKAKKDAAANFSLDCAYATLIPDVKFEEKLMALGIDTDGKNGKVLTANISSLTSLDVSGAGITDLSGIEDFTFLESLITSENSLTKIDVSKNQRLISLSVGQNQLTRLEVNNNTKLQTIYCNDNLLATLDLSKNTNLIGIYCPNNKLISLNLKNGNNIASDGPGIKNFTNNPDLKCIQVDDETYANTKWTYYKDATANYSSNCDYSTAIPDPKFEDKLIALGIDSGEKNGKVATANITELTALDVSTSEISDLTGIQDFISLKTLSVRSNQLKNLDVSKNLNLQTLEASSNQIASIDISKNTNLVSLSISNNQLSSIELAKNAKLTTLSINYNKVSALDISKNTSLNYLSAIGNKLASLDVSGNLSLSTIDVASNLITALDVSGNTTLVNLKISQNLLTTLDISKNPAITFLTVNNNQLTSLNLKNGKNTKLTSGYISLYTNPKLYCILVDDVTYANTNWLNNKDAIATYNTECTGELTLPTNNFAIETKGESCLGENNGEISIVAKTAFDYVATVNDKPYAFTNNSLKVTALVPGVYQIKITIPNMIFEQNFNVTIAKGATIAGKSSIASKKVAIEITEGTAPFTVFVDGTEQFQTNDSNFSVELNEGGLIEVATAKACEGVYAKKIKTTEILGTILSAYPNPTSGTFEIEIPTDKNEVTIELYSFGGQLVSSKKYVVENGTAKLSLENQPSGIYAAKIYLETPEYIKIIKK